MRRRIDEMATDVELQLVTKLGKLKFTVQLDETTVRNSEALLLAYVRYIEDGEFREEILFCQSLPTTTTAADIYGIYKNYMSYGASAMMGRRQGCLKLKKNDNSWMLTL